MSESLILPVVTLAQLPMLEEIAAEGGEDTPADFRFEEVTADQILIETAFVDLPVATDPSQDRLETLIENLSGITGAFREAVPPATEEPVMPQMNTPAPDLSGKITVAPEPAARITVTATPEPLPAPVAQIDGAMSDIDLSSADAPLLTAVAPRDTAAAPAVFSPQKIPVASIAQQIAEAVVIARDDRVEVALAPEELGRIRMIVTGPDHNPHVLIWAERPEILDQLRRNASFLQECFGDAGMADASFEFQGEDFSGSEDNQPLPDAMGQDARDMAEPVSVPLAWMPMTIPARLDIRI